MQWTLEDCIVEIDPLEYREIEEMIQSADSPVGIDAKKTHVYIIHMLRDIQRRLSDLEAKVHGLEVRV